MGKTTLTLDMVLNALAKGKEVAVFCPKMSATQCIKRLVDVLSKRADLIEVTESESMKNTKAAITWLSDKPLSIDDTPGIRRRFEQGKHKMSAYTHVIQLPIMAKILDDGCAKQIKKL